MKVPAIKCQGYSLEVGSSIGALDSRKPSKNKQDIELIARTFTSNIGDITYICQLKS